MMYILVIPKAASVQGFKLLVTGVTEPSTVGLYILPVIVCYRVIE